MKMDLKVSKDFDLNKFRLDLSEELKDGINMVARDIEHGIDRGSQFGKPFKKNAISTIRLKGFDHPLKETGLMKNKNKMIKRFYKKADEQIGELLPNEKRIDIGYWNQEGTNKIPSRPWFGISEDAERKVVTKIEEKIKKQIEHINTPMHFIK